MEKGIVGNKKMDTWIVSLQQKIASDIYLFLLFTLLLFCPIIFLQPSIHGNDGVLNYVYIRSFFFDKDFDFTNEYIQFDKIKNYPYKFVDIPKSPATGHYVNRYGIGSSILWAPFFITAHLLTKVACTFNISNISPDGYTYPYVLAISIGSVFYASSGLLLLYLLCKNLFKKKYAFLAVIAIFFCSPLFFYTYFHPSMSHANSFFLISALLFILKKLDKENSTFLYVLSGIISGLIVVTRFQDITFLAILPIFFLYQIKHSRNRNQNINSNLLLNKKYFVSFRVISRLILGLIPFAIILFPQMYVWHYLYGSYIAGPMPYLQYSDFSLVRPIHFFQILFSSLHGVFFWHPLLLIGVIGLFIGVGERWLVKAGIIGFLLNVYLLSCWEVWYGGASYGNRMFISSLPIIAFGFANIFNRLKNKLNETVIIIIIILFIFWNFGLMYQYGKNMIPHQDYISYKTLITNFIEIIRSGL